MKKRNKYGLTDAQVAEADQDFHNLMAEIRADPEKVKRRHYRENTKLNKECRDLSYGGGWKQFASEGENPTHYYDEKTGRYRKKK